MVNGLRLTVRREKNCKEKSDEEKNSEEKIAMHTAGGVARCFFRECLEPGFAFIRQ